MAYPAFSTWFQATNSVLNLAQLPVVASTTVFDNGPLTKYQNAAKYKVDFANRHLTGKMVTAFANRKFALDIVQGTQAYALDTGISAEQLKYHSFYNITAGSAYAQHLNLVKYEDYMDMWPDQTIVESGPPLYVVQVPYDSVTDGPPSADSVATTLTPMIWIYPIPDNSYTLQYQAHLNAPVLTASGSYICWPPAYEHGLWSWAWKFLEIDLAEGREQMLDALVDEVVSRIKVASQPAEEVRKGVRMMKLSRRRSGRGWGIGYFG